MTDSASLQLDAYLSLARLSTFALDDLEITSRLRNPSTFIGAIAILVVAVTSPLEFSRRR
jgi:hypothetical protein